MNLTQLRYFVKLAELEHYGRASKELYISQPALSNAIRQLEEELGFALFEKKGRNVVLTDYGREFNLHVINALRELDKGINLGAAAAEGKMVSLATVSSIQKEFLPSLLSSYRQLNSSEVVFDVWEERTTFRCMKALREGRVDLVFCAYFAEEADMRWIPVLPQWLYAVTNPEHVLAERTAVSLKELKDYSTISYRAGSALCRPVKRLSDAYGFSVREAFEDEISALTQVLGIDSCSVALIIDHVESTLKEQVCFIPIEELESPFHMVYLGYKTSTIKSQEARNFIDFIEERAAPIAGIIPLENEPIWAL